MIRTRPIACAWLVALALMLLTTAPAAAQQPGQMPTTVEQWQEVYANLDEGAPSNFMQAMAAQQLQGFRAAYPDLPEQIKASLRAGEDLSTQQINQVLQAMTAQMQSQAQAQNPGGNVTVRAQQVQPGTQQERAFNALMKVLITQVDAGAGGAQGAAGNTQGGQGGAAQGMRGGQAGGAAAAQAQGQGQAGNQQNQNQGQAAGQQPGGQVDVEQARSLWEDFIHYTRIAQLQLAVSSGQALMQAGLASDQWLQIVENSPYAQDYDRTLRRAQRMEGEIAQVAQQVAQRVEQARIDLAREGGRIRNSIGKLDDGLRARMNAEQRLQAAGQYAAPHLLEVLTSTSPEAQAVRPYAIDAMVRVGRPLVSPFCQALNELPPVPKQQVAEVLGRIGYPIALPYLKAELERGDLAPAARGAIRTAFDQIVRNSPVSRSASAATLFLQLSEDYYAQREVLIPEPEAQANLMWQYESGVGLTFLEIPTPIYYEAQAMRACRRSLQLNPNMTASLSLWLASNFRRENNLPQGAEDPSYTPRMRSPHFYATLAGARHLQPVLQRAIDANDSALALDAIRALTSTSSARSLLNTGSDFQPLITAMNYPDRRVRFEAAFAIAQARPNESFSGDRRVVPVLAEALRVGGQRYAVAIAPDQQTLNQTTQIIGSAGNYQMIVGDSIDAVREQVQNAPSVDLIVLNIPTPAAQSAVAAASDISKLQAAPVVVLAPADRASAEQAFRNNPRVSVASAGSGPQQLAESVQQAAASVSGGQLSQEQATGYALTALDLLLNLAMDPAGPFQASNAQPALIAALGDSRNEVVLRAAEVLARLQARQAQQAIADAALSSERGQEMQIQLLNSLARSARQHGNMLLDRQLDDLIALVNNSQGPLADAASEAYGALNLPTSNAVDLITSNAGPQQAP